MKKGLLFILLAAVSVCLPAQEKENAAKIWHHKLSFLNEKECLELASQFEFSGGEMENIARKCVMYKILHEKNPNFEEVHSLCINEKWDTDRNRVKIGF